MIDYCLTFYGRYWKHFPDRNDCLIEQTQIYTSPTRWIGSLLCKLTWTTWCMYSSHLTQTNNSNSEQIRYHCIHLDTTWLADTRWLPVLKSLLWHGWGSKHRYTLETLPCVHRGGYLPHNCIWRLVFISRFLLQDKYAYCIRKRGFIQYKIDIQISLKCVPQLANVFILIFIGTLCVEASEIDSEHKITKPIKSKQNSK